VAVVAPVFLSEEEAYQVICQAAEAEGIHFSRWGAKLSGVGIPQPDQVYLSDGQQIFSHGFTEGELELDGYDAERKVGFEFVSTKDIDDWAVNITPNGASFTDYEFLDTARALGQGLSRQADDTTLAVFYDPTYRPQALEAVLASIRGDYLSKREQYNRDKDLQNLDGLNAFLKALNASAPVSMDSLPTLWDDQSDDAQKFVYITLKDGCQVQLRLFKEGYVAYNNFEVLFKVEKGAFEGFWNALN
jgi:hypothetical protein